MRRTRIGHRSRALNGLWRGRHGRRFLSRRGIVRPRRPLSKSLLLPISPNSVTYASLPLIQPSQPRSRLLRVMKRWALMGGGLLVVLLGILIAPLPGPGGIPVIAVGLMLILRSSFWAKRQFIRAQYARPKWVYPFRRLMRRKPEIAPVFWQQALRAEKLVLRRRRRLVRVRKRVRRYFRKLFRRSRA